MIPNFSDCDTPITPKGKHGRTAKIKKCGQKGSGGYRRYTGKQIVKEGNPAKWKVERQKGEIGGPC